MILRGYDSWEPEDDPHINTSQGVASIFCDNPPESMPPCRPVGFVQ